MNKLEMYKKLSDEDKSLIIEYWIFNCIYDVARGYYEARELDFEMSDEIVNDIQKLAFRLYIDDITYHQPPDRIAKFLTRCYLKDNTCLEKIKNADDSDIFEAIDYYDYDFYNDL